MAITLGQGKANKSSAVVAKPMLDVCDVAAELQLSELEIMRLICQTRLTAHAINSGGKTTWKVDSADLQELVSEGGLEAGANLPEGLLASRVYAEQKTRAVFREAADSVTSEATIRAEMQRVKKPDQRLIDVATVSFGFNSAPGDFAERLNGPALRGEMASKIRILNEPPKQETLLDAFVNARAFSLAKKVIAAEFGMTKEPIPILYQGPEVYHKILRAIGDRLSKEFVTCNSTRLVEIKIDQLENGNTLEVRYQKTPVVVNYSIPVSAFVSAVRLPLLIEKFF